MLTPNQTIGPYTLVRALGQGTFGVVWLAERRGLITTQVALKIPRDTSVFIVSEVTQEAQVWQQASGHPNVLPVIECALYDGHIVIVTEYVADGTLREWMARNGGKPASVEEAVHFAGGILAGLEHLHRQQIIDRISSRPISCSRAACRASPISGWRAASRSARPSGSPAPSTTWRRRCSAATTPRSPICGPPA